MNKLYQVRDNVGRVVIHPIIIVKAEAAAVRIFVNALQDKETQIGQHPKDYDLLYLGNQDDDTGQIAGNDGPTIVLAGAQWETTAKAEAIRAFNERMNDPNDRTAQHINANFPGVKL